MFFSDYPLHIHPSPKHRLSVNHLIARLCPSSLVLLLRLSFFSGKIALENRSQPRQFPFATLSLFSHLVTPKYFLCAASTWLLSDLYYALALLSHRIYT